MNATRVAQNLPAPRTSSLALSKHLSAALLLLFACLLALLTVCALPSKAHAASIAMGGTHSAYLDNSGNLWMWGDNTYGQLGDGTYTERHTPVKVLTDVASVSLGRVHSAAIRKDGTLWTWGNNGNGQLGDGTTAKRNTPKRVTSLSNVASVSLGWFHSSVITKNGTLYAWGSNANGQVGDGTTTDKSTPKQVTSLSNVVYVSLGRYHSAAITKSGLLYTWGSNINGKLGDGTTTQRATPTRITSLSNVASVSLGENHSLATRRDGTVYAWGYGQYGQLGTGATGPYTAPTRITSLSNVASISTSGAHCAAVRRDGTLWMWGNNANGQIGNGTTTVRKTPVKVLNSVSSVSIGTYHSAAMQTNGAIQLWGSNINGKLGDGTTTQKTRPWDAHFNIYSPTLRFASSSIKKTTANPAFVNALALTTDGAGCTYSSSNKSVAIVSSNGTITVNNPGTCKITVSTPAGLFYKAGSAVYTLNVKKGKTPIAVATKFKRTASKSKQSFLLGVQTPGGKLSYKSTSKKVKVKKGKVIIKKGFVGKATITIKAKATKRFKANKKKVKVVVSPSQPKDVKFWSPSKKKFKLSWNKAAFRNGVELKFSKSPNFSGVKSHKYKRYKTRNKSEITLKGSKVKSGKRYYVKFRFYTTYKGKAYHGPWSDVQSAVAR